MAAYVAPLSDFGKEDVGLVGGKNASLGEMLQALQSRGVQVPEGIAVTVAAFEAFLAHNDLHGTIDEQMARLDDGADLRDVGARIRKAIGRGEFPDEVEKAIRTGYAQLCDRYGQEEVDVAVRSSATAEDLPDASFARQQETILNVTGEPDVLASVRRCYTSLFTDRAIHYRAEQGYDTEQVSLSVTIQKMVRSGSACAGVMFTLDPDTGFPNVVVVNGAWGLGEMLVGGNVDPDEWVVYKPLLGKDWRKPLIDKKRGAKLSKMVYAIGELEATKIVKTRRREREMFVLSDDEALQLAEWAVAIEDHYGRPMDIEWAKDGDTGELFVVQARPETVQARAGAASMRSYKLHTMATPIVEGIAIGDSIGAGPVRVLTSIDHADDFVDGDVPATEMPLADSGHDVHLVGSHLDREIIDSVQAAGYHPTFEVDMPETVRAYQLEDAAEAFDGADIAGSGVTSYATHWAADQLSNLLRPGQTFIMVAKGMEGDDDGNLSILPDVLSSRLPDELRESVPVVAIVGPSIAGELAARRHTCVIFAGRDQSALDRLRETFAGPYYHVWTSTDIIGSEICGALKNCYALGSGFADGILAKDGVDPDYRWRNFNYEAALISQGVVESRQLVELLGGRPETAEGLATAGDVSVKGASA